MLERDDHWDKYAIAVPCPTCAAPRGQRCAMKTKWFHNARISRGIRRAIRDDYSQHERAEQAMRVVRAAIKAGRTPDPIQINTSLACACEECLAGMVEQARELLPWL